MNIFVTDINPNICAINLDDKRVKHMPKECFEMLIMALYINTGHLHSPVIIWDIDRRSSSDKFDELFNNKCTKWVAAKREHIWWLWCHSMALLKEYSFRFNQDHYLKDRFIAISHWIPESNVYPKSFANASGYQERTIFDSYKESLIHKWFVTDEIKPIIWTNRLPPKWANYSYIHQGDLFRYNPGDPIEDDLPF